MCVSKLGTCQEIHYTITYSAEIKVNHIPLKKCTLHNYVLFENKAQ